jgi:hypothetical protein
MRGARRRQSRRERVGIIGFDQNFYIERVCWIIEPLQRGDQIEYDIGFAIERRSVAK